MGNTYEKSTGNAGIKGVDFQINLLLVFLLNALRQNIKDWRLSTENKLAGKFDDVVLEFSDGSAILLQAKHKDSRKLTLDQLLSTNSKKEDFSLPKYFFSYLDIKSKFPVKCLIICTNAQADAKVLKLLNPKSVCKGSMLYCDDGASFFTFNDRILSDLTTNAKVYQKNNSRGKDVDETMASVENVKEFLKHLHLYLDYPSGIDMEKGTEKLLSGLTSACSLLRNISYRDLCQKAKDWFEQPQGEYLTERRAKAMFCEIKSDKFRESLEDYKVFFKKNDFKITDSKKRIFHVVAEGRYLLHLMSVHRSLQNNKAKVLYAGSDYGGEMQKQMIEAFELPLYTHLIIISPKFSKESVIDEIYVLLRDILEKKYYKKVIFVAEGNNKLAQRIKSISNDYDVFDKSLALENLSEDTQQVLLKKKSVIFQGEDASLEEIFPEQITDDIKKTVKSEILEKLIRGERITVGVKFSDLEGEVSRYYVDRSFERVVKKVDETNEKTAKRKKEIVSEANIYGVDERLILISDSAGMGKTTVLKNLTLTIKKNNPLMWVVRIELNRCTNILRDSLKNSTSINVWELLHFKNSIKSNELEKLLFSLKTKVVLMLDGVDEISPDYTALILDLLLQSQKAENLAKVFVTTRTHMARELEMQLNVTSFKLVPLTEQNQIDFLTRFWTYSLKLEGGCSSKCERYATILVKRVSSWVIDWQTEVKFAASPLQARMLAEVFLENKGSECWEGCKEYLNADKVEPKLPDKMNIAKLYELFVDKKRDIFMDKGNPSGNTAANQALKDQFEECLAYHRSLALQSVLDEFKCELFSCYTPVVKYSDVMITKMLKIGIVQMLDDQLMFAHRTIAEYFVVETILKELQLQNQNVGFQRFLIDELFLNKKFKVIRRFLDIFLQNHISYLSFDTSDSFKSYMTLVNDTEDYSLIHRLAGEGYTEIIRLVLKCINFRIIRGSELRPINHLHAITEKNTLNAIKHLVERNGIDIENCGLTPFHHAVFSGYLNTVEFLVEMGANVNREVEFSNEWPYLGNGIINGGFVEFIEKLELNNGVVRIGGNTALHSAIGNGWFDIVEFLVKNGANINHACKEGYTALHCAAYWGNYDIVNLLVNFGAEINISNKEGYTAVHFAARCNNLKIIEFLVKHDADINIANNENYTALHFAVRNDNLKIVEFLEKHGAHLNVVDKTGYTALHFALRRGNVKIVEFLVKHGADIHIADNEGYTALHIATESDSFGIVEYLVKHNVEINIADKEGNTPLHLAVTRGSLKLVALLVDHGAEINLVNKEGYTTLHSAVKRGSLEIVEHLVKHGADINLVDKQGNPALHFAVGRSSFNIIEFFISHGADINFANREGYTVLHFAVRRGSLKSVVQLVKHGVDINAMDKEGHTALHFAVRRYSLEIAEYLVKHGADINVVDKEGDSVLHIAAERSSFKIFEFLVNHSTDINFANREGYTLLHLAVRRGSLQIVEHLVKQGADINAKDKEGHTALHFATESDNFDIVEYLVKHDMNINIANKEGDTALHFAARKGSLKLVELLMDHGAEINIANKKGHTALLFAVRSGSSEIVEHFVKHGVNVNTMDKEGYTALYFATERGNFDIAKILIKSSTNAN